MSAADALAIRPSHCDVVATRWRALAAWCAGLRGDVTRRCDGLRLTEWSGPVTTPATAASDELSSAAELLDAVVDAVERSGFDVTSAALGGWVLDRTTVLGDLLADGTGARLVDLDDPTPDRDAVTAHFGYLPLFGPAGPSAADVHQGSLGDCWLVAAIAAIAEADPERLRDVFVDHGDGTYTVTVDGESTTVDDELPIVADGVPLYANGPGNSQPAVLWPMILEKALAVRFGGGYDELDGDDARRALDLFGATDEVELSPRFWPDPSDDDVLDRVDEALMVGGAVVASSGGTFGMGGRHAWTVVATGVDAAGRATVTVRNPWGKTGFGVDGGSIVRGRRAAPTDLDAEEIKLDEATAEVTMPLDDFVEQFDEIDILTEWDDDE